MGKTHGAGVVKMTAQSRCTVICYQVSSQRADSLWIGSLVTLGVAVAAGTAALIVALTGSDGGSASGEVEVIPTPAPGGAGVTVRF